MNNFHILGKLGEGAYSQVYKVKRIADGCIYALKKVKMNSLTEKEKQNALNEVRILASIKSSYIVSYKEAFYDDTEQCLGIVMEYADKGDLYQKICEFKKGGVYFNENEIFRIFICITKGLKALHDVKILHRDLKSANIFLYHDGIAKLGDLNVSKVLKKGLGYTQTGTPYYASPEVWNDQPYDNKSDIWSLGCILYEMISLRPPFRAENMEGLYNKVVKGQYSRLPEKFSSDLSDLIKFLLQINPQCRPSTDEILNHNLINKRLNEVKLNEEVNVTLLKTINFPKNLMMLSDKLPQSNYEIERKVVVKDTKKVIKDSSLLEKHSQTQSQSQSNTKLIKTNDNKERNLNKKSKELLDKNKKINSKILSYHIYIPKIISLNPNPNPNPIKKERNIKSYDKYLKYNNLYLPKSIKDKVKVIPNKKLSPIKKHKANSVGILNIS